MYLSLLRRCAGPIALAVSLAVALTLVSTSPSTAAPRKVESWAVPGDSAITLDGRGYGHGHGLSQNGAEGAARAGLSWKQIVEFYYPGTSWGRVGGRIKVLITADTTSDVKVVAKRGLKLRSLKKRKTWRLPEGKRAKVWRLVGQRGDRTVVQFKRKRGSWRTWRRFRGPGEFSSTTGRTTLAVPGGRQTYRGKLRQASPRGARRERDTVNVVSMESYLRGVVPLEVPALWSPDAVSAQSVAARTYAAFERADSTTPHYHLCDTSMCQVYGGYDAEHPASDAAIRETRRQGLFFDGGPAFTQFSASNGGWSSAGSRPYLVAQEDPYDGWAGNSNHTWSHTVTDADIEKHWPAIGDLVEIQVHSRDGNGEWGGRVGDLSFVGTKGRADVSGDDVRSVLGLKSEWFTFTVAPKPTPRVS